MRLVVALGLLLACAFSHADPFEINDGLTTTRAYVYPAGPQGLVGDVIADATLPIRIVPAASPISGSLVPSRTIGRIPLFVLFDASATTSTLTTKPFHEIQYSWNFGDVVAGAAGTCGTVVVAGEGNWRCGSGVGNNSKNTAQGPVAGHVFESAVPSTVTLTIIDGTNVLIVTQLISPSDWPNDANTICFFNAAVGTGCPSNATQTASSTWNTAVASCTTNKRCLFQRGGTWTMASGGVISSTGPGMLGVYGSGAQPIVTGNFGMLTFSSSTTPTLTDWRAVDLEFDGADGASSVGVGGGGGASQITMLRLNIHNVNEGMSFSTSTLDFWDNDGNPAHAGHTTYQQLAVVDTVISTRATSNSYGAFFTAQYLGWLGNSVTTTASTNLHGVRYPFAGHAAISNSTWNGGGSNVQAMSLRGPPFAGTASVAAGQYSEKNVISDCKFQTPWGAQVVSSTPQNTTSDERIRDEIFERNWFIATSTFQQALALEASNISVRWNLVDMTGSLGRTPFLVQYTSTTGNPRGDWLHFYNNTATTLDVSGGGFTGLSSNDLAITNVDVKNYLAYTPSLSGTIALIGGTGAASVTSGSSNSTDGAGGQIKLTNPNFAASPPGPPADWKPSASYAVGGGVSVPVWSDFNLKALSATRDIGAVCSTATCP